MRTGSLISQSFGAILFCGLVSCAYNSPINEESPSNQAVLELGDNGSLNDGDYNIHSSEELSNNKALKNNILLSDNTGGISILQEINFNEDRFKIQYDGEEPVLNVLTLNSPPRLVVDFLGAKPTTSKVLKTQEGSAVTSIRIGSHSDKLRIVFDLSEEIGQESHSVDASTGEVTVTLPVGNEIQSLRLAEFSDRLGSDEHTGLAQMKMEEGELKEGELEEEPSNVDWLVNNDTNEEISNNAKEEIDFSKGFDLADSQLGTEYNDSKVEEKEESHFNEEIADFSTLDNEPTEFVKPTEAGSRPVLSKIDFNKSTHSSGEVALTLSEEVAFELKQTSPSEYALRLPGVFASEAAKQPLVSLKGKDGIRSVRVSEDEDGVQVRMFIDPGSSVTAFPRGSVILVKGSEPTPARSAAARAQLGEAPKKSNKSYDDKSAQANPTGVQSSDGSKSYTGRLISLDLQDTDIDNALRIIAEVSNLNIIASDDVTGKVTLRLIDVPWDQALDVILKTNGLDQVTEGNVIRIAPVDKLRREREAMRESKRAAENLEDLTVQYVRISYARAEDIRSKVEAVLSERGTVTSDERTNQLIIKDIKSGQKQSQELISKLDLRTPQVLLETQIVEGSRTILRDLGFQWNFSYIQSPQTGNATGLNFPNTVSTGGAAQGNDGSWAVNFPAVISATEGSAITAILDSADGSRLLGARLSALESEGVVNVISRPQVATINNKQATIRSETTVRVRMPGLGAMVATGAGAQAGGFGGGMAFQEFNVGISLEVTPQASPDYYVLMDVNAKSSTFTGEETDNIPNTREREATSTILVKSGQTFALGGVYRIEDQDTLAGVPFFKDIPFLGFLFRRMSFDKRDEELIFFITPHIVEGSFDASSM